MARKSTSPRKRERLPTGRDACRIRRERRSRRRSIVPRLQSAVARVLPAIEATIARLSAGPHHPREMEQAGRTLSSLTRTLRELNALLAEHNARTAIALTPTCRTDIDAFRNRTGAADQSIYRSPQGGHA